MKSAIFDMDGLLLDTERLHQESQVDMAKEFGQTPDPVFPSAVSGTNGEAMWDVIRRHYPAVDPYTFQAGCTERVNNILDRQGPPVKPNARELLEYFREQGIKTALASSRCMRCIRPNLRQAGLKSLFGAAVSGGEVTHGKPELDICLPTAEQISCSPKACYIFEDSVNGIRAGMAADYVAVMVPDLVLPS